MEQFFNLITTIVRDWWIIVLAFTAGGLYLQGQQWIASINKNLDDAQEQRDAHQKVAVEMHALIKDMQRDLVEVKGAMNAVTMKSAQHELELTRNTEQHASIVKALEGHVNDNREHDNMVREKLGIILDRLAHK